MVLNIYGLSLWNLLPVTHTAPRILMWLLDCWKICASLPGSTEVFCTFCFPSFFAESELSECKKNQVSAVAWSYIELVILLLFAGVTTLKMAITGGISCVNCIKECSCLQMTCCYIDLKEKVFLCIRFGN